MHKNSQTTPKVKSKIRIIHIFAPQIIKTDAANFRELVQRLTGKPTDDERSTKKPRAVVEQEPRNNNIFRSNKRKGFHAEGFREKIKGEEEIWRDANTGGGFLDGFSEFDDHCHGFLQDRMINYDQFPIMGSTSQMDVFEESRVA